MAKNPQAGKYAELADRHIWSIARLAEAFDMNRATIKKRLNLEGVQPVANAGTASQVYHLKEAAEAIFGAKAIAAQNKAKPRQAWSGPSDPSQMNPKDRQAYYAAEKARIVVEREEGKLIPMVDVQNSILPVIKSFIQTVETLPDVGERDAGLDVDQIAWLQDVVDVSRETLARSVERLFADARKVTGNGGGVPDETDGLEGPDPGDGAGEPDDTAGEDERSLTA